MVPSHPASNPHTCLHRLHNTRSDETVPRAKLFGAMRAPAFGFTWPRLRSRVSLAAEVVTPQAAALHSFTHVLLCQTDVVA